MYTKALGKNEKLKSNYNYMELQLKSCCIVWLVNRVESICKSTGEPRLIMTKESVRNVTEHIKLPVLIFHEDLTPDIMEDFIEIYKDITFHKLDSFRDNALPYNKSNCKCSKGYMTMCRFFSGILQQHEALQCYEHYIRMDDDSFLIEPFIDIDTFLYPWHSGNSDYVFRTLFKDNAEKINKPNGLFNFTNQFCLQYKLPIHKLIPDLIKIQFLYNDMYTGLAPYNNFHYSSLKLWKHPVIKHYIKIIIDNNFIHKHGWMDANIHAMIIFILAPLIGMKVQNITNFGYRHNRTFSILDRCGSVYRGEESFYPCREENTRCF